MVTHGLAYIDSQIIMKELMKGPNERSREDSENAISDDLETQIIKISSRSSSI
jgi:hypothetical protein